MHSFLLVIATTHNETTPAKRYAKHRFMEVKFCRTRSPKALKRTVT
jgi:hypothetical protein